MKTYLNVYLTSDGEKSTSINDRLMSMGFKPNKGEFDYIYEWEGDVGVEDSLSLADKVHSTLKGGNVFFKLETVEED